jgi:hypothetical protein
MHNGDVPVTIATADAKAPAVRAKLVMAEQGGDGSAQEQVKTVRIGSKVVRQVTRIGVTKVL